MYIPCDRGFALNQALLHSLRCRLPHHIDHQWPDCWLEPAPQGISSSLLKEQGHNNCGLLSCEPPGLVSALHLLWKRGFLVADFQKFGHVVTKRRRRPVGSAGSSSHRAM